MAIGVCQDALVMDCTPSADQNFRLIPHLPAFMNAWTVDRTGVGKSSGVATQVAELAALTVA